MSTSFCGRITSSFIRSSIVVPPARYWAAASVGGGVAGRSRSGGCQDGGVGRVDRDESERPHVGLPDEPFIAGRACSMAATMFG